MIVESALKNQIIMVKYLYMCEFMQAGFMES